MILPFCSRNQIDGPVPIPIKEERPTAYDKSSTEESRRNLKPSWDYYIQVPLGINNPNQDPPDAGHASDHTWSSSSYPTWRPFSENELDIPSPLFLDSPEASTHLHLIILHLFISLWRELNWKLVMESWTLLPLHHWRKIHHLMVLSPGYHLNKVLMNPYLNFMNIFTNIDPLFMNDPYFNHPFNINQLISPYQKCYQITHMEIKSPFTSSAI